MLSGPVARREDPLPLAPFHEKGEGERKEYEGEGLTLRAPRKGVAPLDLCSS